MVVWAYAVCQPEAMEGRGIRKSNAAGSAPSYFSFHFVM